MKLQTQTLAALAVASFALVTSAHAQFAFGGATSSDPTVSSNWLGSVPTYGATNANNLYIQNGATSGGGSPMVYTTTQGSTTFTGNVRVGSTYDNNPANGSTLIVTGGSLLINSSGTSTIGYNGSGTINVSGGNLTINGGDQLWFGNNLAATANVSGTGVFTVGDQFLFSRNGGTATINLSGNGVFNVTGSSGTQYDANGGAGVAMINLGGNGIFQQTGSGTINLTNNFNINFLTGSLGQFSLLNVDTTTLQSYVLGGHILINGISDTTLSDYLITGGGSGAQGIIQLATVP